MIGKTLYQIRSRLRHGVNVAWHREVVRKRILKSKPVVADDFSVAEIHVLTSKADWLNLMWTLKSFYHVAPRPYALAIHDDGTLDDEIRSTFASHFPACRLISRTDADRDVLNGLSGLPKSSAFRRENHLSPKVFDFRHYLRADRMLLLDSDVLFYSEPVELLRRTEDASYMKNTVNGDTDSAYTVAPEIVKQHCDVDLVPRFNSGLGMIHRQSLNLEWIEEFLQLPNILSHTWRIEQTLYALCSSRFGAELLPPDYDVFLDGRVANRPSRHYVGAIRHLMYGEGIKALKKVLLKESHAVTGS